MKDTLILAIESSCDETAASVVKNGRTILSNVISSQIELHKLYGGVVPEIASRKHIEKINQVIEEALKEADVTLDDLAEKFYLSKPYLSKYIKEKSGVTFGELVKKVRMKKARAMLKSSSMTVENIALTVGYQNVEHFNRLFKKAYNMTPVQFRNQK